MRVALSKKDLRATLIQLALVIVFFCILTRVTIVTGVKMSLYLDYSEGEIARKTQEKMRKLEQLRLKRTYYLTQSYKINKKLKKTAKAMATVKSYLGKCTKNNCDVICGQHLHQCTWTGKPFNRYEGDSDTSDTDDEEVMYTYVAMTDNVVKRFHNKKAARAVSKKN